MVGQGTQGERAPRLQQELYLPKAGLSPSLTVFSGKVTFVEVLHLFYKIGLDTVRGLELKTLGLYLNFQAHLANALHCCLGHQTTGIHLQVAHTGAPPDSEQISLSLRQTCRSVS